MVDEGIKGADKVQKLNDNPSKLLGTLLVGNNIVNIASSSIATAVSIKILGAEGGYISTIVMTIIILYLWRNHTQNFSFTEFRKNFFNSCTYYICNLNNF